MRRGRVVHKAPGSCTNVSPESGIARPTAFGNCPPDQDEGQIAETTYGGRRLIVRRTRLVGPQAQLWPDWRHFAFITNGTEDITIVEAEHRDHAVVEQVIVDLKDQALRHFPSGEFNANGTWAVLGALTHNLLRWTQLLGLPNSTVRAARTLRRRLITIAGRLTRYGRSWTLHLPARWPWHGDYLAALARRAPRRLTIRHRQPIQAQQHARPAGRDHRCARRPKTFSAETPDRRFDPRSAIPTRPQPAITPRASGRHDPPTQRFGGSGPK
jgi:Transposase DDE domain group 1